MTDSDQMNIVIVADDNYIQHAGVMLTSLFESNRKHNFRIFLLTDSISRDNTIRLQRLTSAYGHRLEIHIPDNELTSERRDIIDSLNSSSWNKMIYYKLYMPDILPKNIKRCLFLDVDMVVVDDIESLYHTDLGDNAIIAAVEDVVSCISRKDALGIEDSQPYINSGVMVCDINRWREKNKNNSLYNFIARYSDIIINEQDVFAKFFNGRISLLPIRWNMVGCNYLRKKFVFPKYYTELSEARKHPAIHHFCTLIQPWYADSPHPYRHLYVRYLKTYSQTISEPISLTFPYKNKPKTYVQKIRYMVGRILNFFDIIQQPGYVLPKVRY